MKWSCLAIVIASCLLCGSVVSAVSVSPPPATVQKGDSPVIITGYASSGPRLHYVQLFNNSDTVIDVTGWRVQFTITGEAVPAEVAVLQGMMKPGGYLVIAERQAIPNADNVFDLTIPATVTGTVSGVRLLPPAAYTDHDVAVKGEVTTRYWKRNISASSGSYLSTFSSFVPDAHFVLYGNGWYEYPQAVLLQISEVLANPRMCSPLESSGDCMDYVKIYNPSDHSVDLGGLRLRIGYMGQTATPSNTFLLSGSISSGHWGVIATSADGRPISLTNSGSFIWLEDAYGLKLYDSTVMEYPDASADSKKGQAWAYDAADGTWKWTIKPMPFDAPSEFPVLPAKPKVTASHSLVPCKEGQYRSEETNRCRSMASDATVLAPCDDDEERNPATNRCRKLVSLASQQLTPCKEGQERNPETNRCRNIVASKPPEAAFAVETAGEAGKAFIGWWALGGVGVIALGYGAWEWRREIAEAVQKAGSFFTSHK